MVVQNKPVVTDLSFPLNVYTYLLSMTTEKLCHQHHAWFDNLSEPIVITQEQSTKELLTWLPPPPARILKVGADIGTTITALLERGYDVFGVTQDKASATYTRKQYGSEFPVSMTGYEDFELTPRAFDCILLQENIQHIPLTQLFSRAAILLRPGGRLIILAKTTSDKSEDDYQVHSLNDLKTVLGKATQNKSEVDSKLYSLDKLKLEASKHCFDLAKEHNLSSCAQLTLNFLLTAITKYRDDLHQLFMLSDTHINSLNTSSQLANRNYAIGNYSYTALCFHATKSSTRWLACDMPASQSQEMLTLFQEVFKQKLGEPMWHWKYAVKKSHAFGVWNREGHLVAHYAGFIRTLSMFGKSVPALQIGDVMVHTSERAVMTKYGAFFQVTSGFFEKYVGKEKPYLVAFGFPNRRHIRVGQRLKLYASVENIFKRNWLAGNTKLPFWLTLEPLFKQPNWTQIAEKLWQEMHQNSHDFILTHRDSSYLKYRYQDRPDGNYQTYLIRNRLTKSAKFIVVVKKNNDCLDWIDYVGPPAVIPLAINVTQHLAKKSSTMKVTAWLTGCMLESFSGSNKALESTEETDVEIAQSDWKLSKGLADTTRGHWWLMYGDTDFL